MEKPTSKPNENIDKKATLKGKVGEAPTEPEVVEKRNYREEVNAGKAALIKKYKDEILEIKEELKTAKLLDENETVIKSREYHIKGIEGLINSLQRKSFGRKNLSIAERFHEKMICTNDPLDFSIEDVLELYRSEFLETHRQWHETVSPERGWGDMKLQDRLTDLHFENQEVSTLYYEIQKIRKNTKKSK